MGQMNTKPFRGSMHTHATLIKVIACFNNNFKLNSAQFGCDEGKKYFSGGSNVYSYKLIILCVFNAYFL